LMGRVWRAPDALFGIVFLILAISNDWLVSRLGGLGDVCSVKLLNYLRSSPYTSPYTVMVSILMARGMPVSIS